MSAINRATRLQSIHKALKKLFTVVHPPADRSILEHLIYACCLENAPYLSADEALARLQETYLDWNEVRVTTVAELAECLACLKDAEEAAKRVRNTLHSVFETYYSWDLEFLKKENLGKATKILQDYKSISPFVISYVVQNGLGGHSIPIDDAALVVLYALQVIEEDELRSKQVPGLERAIAKNKGAEFGSLLHQLSADLHASPFSPETRNKIIAIDSVAKDRLPKRPSRKKKKLPAAKETKAKEAKSAKPEKTAEAKVTKKSAPNKKKTKDAAPKAVKGKTAAKAKPPTKKPSKKKSTSTLAKKKPR
jgi:endonuclease-3